MPTTVDWRLPQRLQKAWSTRPNRRPPPPQCHRPSPAAAADSNQCWWPTTVPTMPTVPIPAVGNNRKSLLAAMRATPRRPRQTAVFSCSHEPHMNCRRPRAVAVKTAALTTITITTLIGKWDSTVFLSTFFNCCPVPITLCFALL